MQALQLLLPLRCVACRRPGDIVCPSCWRTLPRLAAAPHCLRCGAPTAWSVQRCGECAGRRLAFQSARAAVAYDDQVRPIVAAWKEHGLRSIAGMAADLLAGSVQRPDVDALTEVPPDPDRLLRRGHHSAGRLAAKLARRWDLPHLALLDRGTRVRRQRGLRLAERRKNVAKAFVAKAPSPPRICLVDDVYTTGATVSAAASALRKSGARRVEVVTFARAVR